MAKQLTSKTDSVKKVKAITAKQIIKNRTYSKYVSLMLGREYSPLLIEPGARKIALKLNRTFFNRVLTKKAL